MQPGPPTNYTSFETKIGSFMIILMLGSITLVPFLTFFKVESNKSPIFSD